MIKQPKKSNVFLSRILPIVLCVLLAFFTWICVMSISDPHTTYEFDRVEVIYEEDAVEGYTVMLKGAVSVAISGTRSDVVKCLQTGLVLEMMEEFEPSKVLPGAVLAVHPEGFRVRMKDGSPLPYSVKAVFSSVDFSVVQA